MALNAYLKLRGEKQGDIKGSVTFAQREGSIMVIGFSHEVISPRDAASGLPTGKRQHKPLTITKEIDSATPLLFTLLANNENIVDFKLDFWHPSKTGKEVPYYSIELVNAQIAGIRAEMLNNKYPENTHHKVREHISFTYQRIIETFIEDNITAEDIWETIRI